MGNSNYKMELVLVRSIRAWLTKEELLAYEDFCLNNDKIVHLKLVNCLMEQAKHSGTNYFSEDQIRDWMKLSKECMVEVFNWLETNAPDYTKNGYDSLWAG